MLCEKYKDTLIETAANGGALRQLCCKAGAEFQATLLRTYFGSKTVAN